MWTHLVQQLAPDRVREGVACIDLSSVCYRTKKRRHGRGHITSGRLPHLHIGIDGPVVAAAVQVFSQRQQIGSLAHLARGVEDKVFVLLDKQHHIIQIEAL